MHGMVTLVDVLHVYLGFVCAFLLLLLFDPPFLLCCKGSDSLVVFSLLRLTESFPQFKRLLHAWDGDICGCPSCLFRLCLCFSFAFVFRPSFLLCCLCLCFSFAFVFRPSFLLCCKGSDSLGVFSLQLKLLNF